MIGEFICTFVTDLKIKNKNKYLNGKTYSLFHNSYMCAAL